MQTDQHIKATLVQHFQNLHCRGPLVLSDDYRKLANISRNKYFLQGDLSSLRKLCVVVGDEVGMRIQEGMDLGELSLFCIRALGKRKGCGHKLLPHMLESKCDGIRQTLACPDCGTTLAWELPLSEECAQERETQRMESLQAVQ